MLGHTSIRARVTTLSLLCMIVLIAAISVVNIRQNDAAGTQMSAASRDAIGRAIKGQLESAALAQSVRIERIFSDQYAVLGQLSAQLINIQNVAQRFNTAAENSRVSADEAIKATFSRDGSLLGAWGIMEPNQFGSDAAFLNAVPYGSNDKGRFASYWNRSTGTSSNAPTAERKLYDEAIGESGLPFNYFYRCPFQTHSPCLAPPSPRAWRAVKYS